VDIFNGVVPAFKLNIKATDNSAVYKSRLCFRLFCRPLTAMAFCKHKIERKLVIVQYACSTIFLAFKFELNVTEDVLME
jgi:hypothetical protein